MTEEEVGRQAEGEQEPAAPPTPAIASGDSPAAGSAEPSFDVGALGKRLDEFDKKLSVLEKLPEIVDNRVKSIKDKSINKLLAYADDLEALVQASGGDLEKIRPQLEQRAIFDRLDQIEQKLGTGGATGIASNRADPDDAAEILQKAGISFGDAEVAEWANKSFTSESQAQAALKALVTKRAKQGNVTPAATVGSPGGAPPSADAEYEAVIAELNEYEQGEHGSLGNREVYQKYQELAKKANELVPPFTDYNRSDYQEP